MPSVADWRMSSEEIWSRRREPVVSAMAPATRPVLTTKKTAAAARMAGTSAAREPFVVGQHAGGHQDAARGGDGEDVLGDVEGAARGALAIDEIAED